MGDIEFVSLAETPRFPLRLPADLRERLERIAEEEHRTLTNLIVHALWEWLERRDQGSD